MPDESRKVSVDISTTYDGKGAQQAAADQEKLTVGQQNLAPATAQSAAALAQFDSALSKQSQELIRGTTAQEAYVVKTEEEYLAIQKAHDALEAKIPLLQAAGKDTTSYQLALANLSEALSTEKALTIAQTIEQQAANKAKLDAFEASQAEATAQVKEAEATTVNTVALREQLVVMRELMSGRLNRLPGSLSILAGASGVGPALTNGIMMATMAFVGLDMALGAIEKHDAPLEKILVEDLTAGIDKADALATAWTGIADAVSQANDQFDSAEQIYARAVKDVNSQLDLTNQLIAAEKNLALQRLKDQLATGQITQGEYDRKRAAIEGQASKAEAEAKKRAAQEELAQKANEAANAQAQADAAKRKAEGFKLPASDEAEKAQSDALSQAEKARREQGENQKGFAAQIQDAQAQGASSGSLSMLGTAGFWKFFGQNLLEHGLAGWNYETGGQMAKENLQSGKEQIDIANATAQEQARIETQIKERDAARQEAEKKAAEAEKARKDLEWEGNPANTGSIAAKIKGDTAAENISEAGAGESELAADIKQIQKDLAIHGPGAQAAMKDAAAALKDAVATFAALAELGDDVRQFKEELASLKQQVQSNTTATQRAINYSTGGN